MKALKIILLMLVLIAVAFAIIAYSGPQNIEIKVEKTIDAPNDVINKYASQFAFFDQWNPWIYSERSAESITTEVSGADGEESAQLKWRNKKSHEKGIQTLRSLKKNERIDFDLLIEGEPSAQYSLTLHAENDSTTTVNLNYQSEFNGLIPRFFATLQGGQQKKELSTGFEKGLNNLKLLSENYKNLQFSGYNIKRKKYSGGLFLAKRDTIPTSAITPFLGQNFYRAMYQIQDQNVKTVGMPTGIYFDFLGNDKTDIAAGIGIQGDIHEAPGFEIIGIPAAQALELMYFGEYTEIDKAHNAMDEYLEYFNLIKTDPVLEEYITDPSLEPDTSKWKTKITYFLKN